MKKSIAVVFAAATLLWNAAPALADEASKQAKIEEILQLTHADRMMTQMFDQMKSSVAAQVSKMDVPENARDAAAEMQRKILDMVSERMSWERAKPKLVAVYDETFTETDIDGILGFYKSPAGQRMLEKMPELMQKSMAVGQQLVGDVFPEIKRMMEEMKEKAQKPQP
jgi:hypothetical protein